MLGRGEEVCVRETSTRNGDEMEVNIHKGEILLHSNLHKDN